MREISRIKIIHFFEVIVKGWFSIVTCMELQWGCADIFVCIRICACMYVFVYDCMHVCMQSEI